MKIIVLHPDEAREMITTAVAEAVAAALAEHARQEAARASVTEGFVTRQEAAELLSCSLSTVDQLAPRRDADPRQIVGQHPFRESASAGNRETRFLNKKPPAVLRSGCRGKIF
jgi:hypothetical protein